jgi:peptidyl-prolyl cis-trans isomerase SurA
MKKIFIIYFALLFVVLSCLRTPLVSAEVVNRVIAVINDKVITYSDLMRMLYPLFVQYQKVYTRSELETKLKEARTDVLNQLVENELILQEARKIRDAEKNDSEIKEKMMDIPDKMVKEQVAAIIANFPSKEAFEQSLAQEQMTLQEFEESIRDQLMVKKLTARQVAARVFVTPEDIQKYYEENKEKFMKPEEYHIFHILIKKTGDSVKDSEQKKMLEDGLKLISDEASFQAFAKKYSEGPNKEEGGDMGFIKKGILLKELDDAMSALKAGEISPIIETDIGYHAVLCKAKKMSEYTPVEEVWDQINSEIFAQKADEIRKKWIQELRDKAYIKIVEE